MSTPQRGGPNLSFAGVVLLALLGTFAWKNAPLDSARPTDGNHEWLDLPQDHALPAKLWQDPFAPILGSDEYDHMTAVLSKLKTIPRCSLHDADRHLGIDHSGLEFGRQNLRVLMPMLTQGQDPEKIERRRRRRYAVISALSEAGYVPRKPDELQVCHFKKMRGTWHPPFGFLAPYEWYVPDGASQDKPPVLVLWLNETMFSKDPFGKFSHLAQQVAGSCDPSVAKSCSRNIDMFVLGPARSSTLIKLASAASKISPDKPADTPKKVRSNKSVIERRFSKTNINSFHILSPTATVADSEIDRHLGDQKFSVLQDDFKPSNCDLAQVKNDTDATPCISFLRTIQTDDVIAAALVDELKERITTWNVGNQYVALIFERDTSFGRALPKMFNKEICSNGNTCENIKSFGYFRGVDGFVPEQRNKNSSSSSRSKDGVQQHPLTPNESFIRPPAGTGQFDYLRRLARDIKSWDTDLRRENKGRVRAIGILGSDIYDKLLVLRALKGGFPSTIFFTTDLDAQLSHPSEYQWTRNLIVGSTFGFKLREDIQGTTPPFRDSYQTSLYLSTLLATKFNYPDCKIPGNKGNFVFGCDIQQGFSVHIPEQIFEIGRFGAVKMPIASSGEATDILNADPAMEPRLLFAIWLKLAALTILLIFVVHQLKPAAGKLVIGLSACAVGLFGLLYIAMCNHFTGEPLLLTQGISVWPTEFMRFIAFCLAVFFIVRLSRDLHNNCYRLNRDYFGDHSKDAKLANHDKTLKEVWHNIHCPSIKQHFKNNPRILGILIPIVLVGYGMRITMENHITNPLWVGVYWGLALLFWYPLLYWFIGVKSINDWAKKNLTLSAQTIPVLKYWKSYCELGDFRERSLRSLTLWLLYMSFAALTFILTGVPDPPTRGDLSFGVDKALTILSVSSMLILLFIVLDEFRMCNYWIQGFIQRKFEWSGIEVPRHGTSLKLDGSRANIEWFKIRLIADRTSEIGQLIYYPSLVIIVMLLSRHSYFDNWGMPPGIAVVISINILLLFMAAVKLRRQAEACRKHAIESLSLEAQGLDADKAKPITTAIAEIRAIQGGAFLPLHEQPLVRASLPLLGAIGLTVSEYMRMLN